MQERSGNESSSPPHESYQEGSRVSYSDVPDPIQNDEASYPPASMMDEAYRLVDGQLVPTDIYPLASFQMPETDSVSSKPITAPP